MRVIRPQSDAPDAAEKELILTGDVALRIWSPEGELLAQSRPCKSAIVEAALKPDGTAVATLAEDRQLRLWVLQGGGSIFSLGKGGSGHARAVQSMKLAGVCPVGQRGVVTAAGAGGGELGWLHLGLSCGEVAEGAVALVTFGEGAALSGDGSTLLSEGVRAAAQACTGAHCVAVTLG